MKIGEFQLGNFT